MKEKLSNIKWVALGVLLGILIGIAQDNIGLWLSLGVTTGVAIDYTIKEKTSRNKDNKNTKS
jgi:EamA domain-containing membrane protein RarD